MDSNNNSFREQWLKGYGVITHSKETVERIDQMVKYLHDEELINPLVDPYQILSAADRLTNAAMWIVVHMAYTQHIYLDGRELSQTDFKTEPQGHTGSSLNVTPGYIGYMVINAIMGKTRGWVMGQGHAVGAIDTVNLLLDNMTPNHKSHYDVSDSGLTKYINDFYSYKLNSEGKQDSPLGSHVNPNTGGAIMESGYLGFTEVQHAHMALPGERLVAFLSDGAFEEQRGSDWTPRWWREEDSGLVTPIMIANGRRIDQRSTMSMEGGVEWFSKYLTLHNFDPIVIDGRDPSAFAWVIFESERRLKHEAQRIDTITSYDVPIPYGIAVAPKGAGFYNEGTNHAHNLPLVTNPYADHVAAERFNTHAAKLFVPRDLIIESADIINNHKLTNRVKEKDNPIANRDVKLTKIPELDYIDSVTNKLQPEPDKEQLPPVMAIDRSFLAYVEANPQLRPRVGNPDEFKSNRMYKTLEALEFRVTHPEGGVPESVFGKIITALNEEAIAGAAFGNKGGINIIVTYEAFGAKMFGEARQEVIFSKHRSEVGRPSGWLSVPIILASHTWENGKNELSHQDPSMAESMLTETSDISRVLFPADYNQACAVIENLYQTKGQIWTIVVSKTKTPSWFNKDEARDLIKNGGIVLPWAGFKPNESKINLIAIGTYQLIEILKTSTRLTEKGVPNTVSYIIEPGRFRIPRNDGEKKHSASPELINSIFNPRFGSLIFNVHTRTELIAGIFCHLTTKKHSIVHGFINQGGTLNASGLLFVNRASWAHILDSAISSLELSRSDMFTPEEISALDGKLSPDGIIH